MSTKKKHKFSNPFARLGHTKRAQWSALKKKEETDSDSDSGSASGGSGGSGTRRRSPGDNTRQSYLVQETKRMELQRRQVEKDGQRKFARVNEKEHSEDEQNSPEGELLNDIKNHPWLDSQRFDGVDPDVSPVPPLNTEARREYDNALRLQNQLRNEKRMENAPQASSAPKPSL